MYRINGNSPLRASKLCCCGRRRGLAPVSRYQSSQGLRPACRRGRRRPFARVNALGASDADDIDADFDDVDVIEDVLETDEAENETADVEAGPSDAIDSDELDSDDDDSDEEEESEDDGTDEPNFKPFLRDPDFDFTNDAWMHKVEAEVGWSTFWEHLEFFTQSDVPVRVGYEESGHYKYGCKTDRNREPMDRADKLAMALQAFEKMAGTPGFTVPIYDRVEPGVADELEPMLRIREEDLDEWTLRARREKALHKQELDCMWNMDQVAQFDLDVLNITDLNDQRTKSKLRAEKLEWSDEEIWDFIGNYGQSVNPFVVRESPTFLEQNPLAVWDWASQGITYVEETEDWLHSIGHMIDPDDEKLPSELRSAMLDSEFADFDESLPAQSRSGEVSGEAADSAMAAVAVPGSDED